MAPKKFGLFKGRSREQHEPPSTENLLNSSSSCDTVVVSPPSPIPSTSRGYHHDDSAVSEFTLMRVDSDDDDEEDETDIVAARRAVMTRAEENMLHYQTLPSASATSMTTLDLQDMEFDSQEENLQKFELPSADDATSIDVNSIQFDATSIDVNSIQFDVSSLASQDLRYCGAGAAKKMKKNKPRPTQDLTDEQMWAVPNTHVMERLLKRNCSINELIKWEAIALARGICTLTTNCVCHDCNPGLPPQALTDGDAGMANASFLSAVSIGCQLQ